MGNHSVIEHRANYHYVKLEEDYLAICSHGKTSPHCKALILSILEHWTNTKRDLEKGEWVYMSLSQWVKYTYMLYERNAIIECLQELLEQGYIERRAIEMFNQDSYEYKLNVKYIQERIRTLPEKDAKDILPNLTAYTSFRDARKEENRVKREERRLQQKQDEQGVVEKSTTLLENQQGVVEKSTDVVEKSTGGLLKNQHNLDSSTNLILTSTITDASASDSRTQLSLISPESQAQPAQSEQKSRKKKVTQVTTTSLLDTLDDELKTRVTKVYETFDSLKRETMDNPRVRYARTDTDTQEILTLIDNESPTMEGLEDVYRYLWKQPRDERSGFHWQEHMTIKNVCKQYPTKIMVARRKPAKTPAPVTNPTVINADGAGKTTPRYGFDEHGKPLPGHDENGKPIVWIAAHHDKKRRVPFGTKGGVR